MARVHFARPAFFRGPLSPVCNAYSNAAAGGGRARVSRLLTTDKGETNCPNCKLALEQEARAEENRRARRKGRGEG